MTSAPVLVGVDLSSAALDAVAWGVAAAESRECDLVLAHAPDAVDTELAAAIPATEGNPMAMARAALGVHRSIAARMAPDISIDTLVLSGAPADVLVEASCEAGLLVLGSRGRADFRKSALGSVGFRVAVHAHCPVAVVPPGVTHQPPSRIVVGVAGGPAGRGALEFAVAEAERTGATLGLVHCVAPAGGGRDQARTRLETLLAELRAAHPRIEIESVADSDEPAPTLVGEARDADLIVLGCHHDENPFAARLGSVPAAVLALAPCPVVLVGRAG